MPVRTSTPVEQAPARTRTPSSLNHPSILPSTAAINRLSLEQVKFNTISSSVQLLCIDTPRRPISVNSTVAELTPSLNQKLLPHQERETHKLYLKERGRERVLAPTERLAAIVIRRLQQAGYDQAHSLAFLGADDMTFLMKFLSRSQLLGPTAEELTFDEFEIIDLTGCNASSIVYLNLSCYPAWR
ncbi:hypothetical protein M405DRAFT_878960 [Rhizopogon salebrosus TDB-379]|nr:hypothetical protein M405DRAFT_878960 [Rhizopogon salebrosus TDB-379]